MPTVQEQELDSDQEREAFLRALEQIYLSLQDVAFDVGLAANEQHAAFARALVTSAYQRIKAQEHREPTPARLALYSGISRSHCKAILEDSRFEPSSLSTNAAALVLAHWHKSTRFSNVLGVPIELPLVAEDGRDSFSSLVADVVPSANHEALLSALLKARSVELLGNGYVRALSLVLYDKEEKEPRFLRMGRLVRNFIDVWGHNFRSAKTSMPSLLEIEAAVDRPLSAVEFLNTSADVRKMCEQFIHDIDLRLNREKEPSVVHSGVRCGLGMYFYVDRDSLNEDVSAQLLSEAESARKQTTATFVDLAPQL